MPRAARGGRVFSASEQGCSPGRGGRARRREPGRGAGRGKARDDPARRHADSSAHDVRQHSRADSQTPPSPAAQIFTTAATNRRGQDLVMQGESKTADETSCWRVHPTGLRRAAKGSRDRGEVRDKHRRHRQRARQGFSRRQAVIQVTATSASLRTKSATDATPRSDSWSNARRRDFEPRARKRRR